jgi:hypothetical protein
MNAQECPQDAVWSSGDGAPRARGGLERGGCRGRLRGERGTVRKWRARCRSEGGAGLQNCSTAPRLRQQAAGALARPGRSPAPRVPHDRRGDRRAASPGEEPRRRSSPAAGPRSPRRTRAERAGAALQAHALARSSTSTSISSPASVASATAARAIAATARSDRMPVSPASHRPPRRSRSRRRLAPGSRLNNLLGNPSQAATAVSTPCRNRRSHARRCPRSRWSARAPASGPSTAA